MIFVNRASAQTGIVSVYPSPAKETATIDVNIESKLGGSIDIFSMNGQHVYHQFIDQKGTHQVNIAVQDFQQGVYLVKYQDEKMR